MNKYLVYIQRKQGFSGESIPGHRKFIQSARDQGILLSAGGFPDQTGGAYVIQAETFDHAAELIKEDPMFTENECVYTIKEWNVQ